MLTFRQREYSDQWLPHQCIDTHSVCCCCWCCCVVLVNHTHKALSFSMMHMISSCSLTISLFWSNNWPWRGQKYIWHCCWHNFNTIIFVLYMCHKLSPAQSPLAMKLRHNISTCNLQPHPSLFLGKSLGFDLNCVSYARTQYNCPLAFWRATGWELHTYPRTMQALFSDNANCYCHNRWEIGTIVLKDHWFEFWDVTPAIFRFMGCCSKHQASAQYWLPWSESGPKHVCV